MLPKIAFIFSKPMSNLLAIHYPVFGNIRQRLSLWVLLCVVGLNHSFAQKLKYKPETPAYERLQSDSIPELVSTNLETIDEQDFEFKIKKIKLKRDKKKKRVYMGVKTKRGKVMRNSQITIQFRYPKRGGTPEDPYAQEIFYYDYRAKAVRTDSYDRYQARLKKGEKLVPLHGYYRQVMGRQTLEEGFLYYGVRNETWYNYDKDGILLERLTYNFGWLKDADISYYGGNKIKEVMPFAHGTKHGNYCTFYENGNLCMQGQYEYGEKVGLWTEYHPNGKRKAQHQYKRYFYEEDTPFVLREWDAGGNLIYEAKKTK
jgi:hypothetical protein